jgi:hypothetical protein
MRTDPRPPFIDSLLLRQIDADMLVELPTQAQDLVKQSRGERTSLGRGLSDSEGHVGPAEVHELEMLIERGDWLEAGYFYDQIFKTGQFDSASPAADAARAFLWRTGQWREAKDRLAERDRFSPGDHDLRGLPYQIAATRLEMRAEFGFRELLKRLRTDPGLALYAQDVVARGFRSELSAGALGFALRLCDLASTESYQRFDVVAATFATWSDGHGSDATTSFSTAQERFPWQEVSPPPHPDDAAGRARLLAILTPYSQAADSLSRLPDDDRITSHAESTVYHLRHLDGLPPRGTHPWTAPPGTARMNDITTMTGLGLFAEWVGAAAFSLRNPHLTLLARSAERWRSTTAGRWSYDSAPPAGSPSRTRLDASISDRILALADDPSPIDASREQLAAWSGDVQPVEVLLEQIAHRFPTALKDGRLTADAGPEAAARVLLDRHVPSAFVPALAILLTHQQLRIGDLT